MRNLGNLCLIFGNILKVCNISRVKKKNPCNLFLLSTWAPTWIKVSHSDILKKNDLYSGNAHCVKLHWPTTYMISRGQNFVVTQKRSLSLELIISVAVPSVDWPPGEAGPRLFQLISYPFTKGKKMVTVLLKSKTNFWGNGAFYFVMNSAILFLPYRLFRFCLY